MEGDFDATYGPVAISTGLEYDPGTFSAPAEVLTLAKSIAPLGGRYISHIRSEDRDLWPAIEEVLRIGREAKIPVQISHMKLAMRGLWPYSSVSSDGELAGARIRAGSLWRSRLPRTAGARTGRARVAVLAAPRAVAVRQQQD